MQTTTTKLIHQCRKCGHKFPATPFAIPIIGKSVPERLNELGGAFMKHMGEKHPEDFAMLMQAGQNVLYFLTSQFFELGDEMIIGIADAVRAETHRRTRLHWLEDYQLEQIAHDIVNSIRGDTDTLEESARKVTLTLRDLRNLIGEEPIPEDPAKIAKPA